MGMEGIGTEVSTKGLSSTFYYVLYGDSTFVVPLSLTLQPMKTEVLLFQPPHIYVIVGLLSTS
jgi:hypothetical protein